MNKNSAIFPSKDFKQQLKKSVLQKESLEISIFSSWRIYLIKKSLNAWPVSIVPDKEFVANAKIAWTITNLMFPSLMMAHWAFIQKGYKFSSFSEEEKILKLSYSMS